MMIVPVVVDIEQVEPQLILPPAEVTVPLVGGVTVRVFVPGTEAWVDIVYAGEDLTDSL